jgi:alpha-tubulin suppressor-like RCC1 family protein
MLVSCVCDSSIENQEENCEAMRRLALPADCSKPQCVQVVCAGSYSFLLTIAGELYSTGCNRYGILGNGTQNINNRAFKRVMGGISNAHVVWCAADDDHAACVDSAGLLYTWGAGNKALGLCLSPHSVPLLSLTLCVTFRSPECDPNV